jgi:hypothetical protein
VTSCVGEYNPELRANSLQEQRDKLLKAVRYALISLSQSDNIPPIVLKDVVQMLHDVNQEVNLP